ncbi:hypothetical protein TNCV_2172681 [Trichonephila clavipes]|nr:hypothetical protein TNCV_2172681 [Trichonephila clavipes]
MARSPRVSAFAMQSLLREATEDSPVEKSELESERSNDIYTENTAVRKRKGIDQQEPELNVKQRKVEITRKSSTPTDFQQEFAAVGNESNGTHTIANTPDVIKKRKGILKITKEDVAKVKVIGNNG